MKTNETIFQETGNAFDFAAAGGTWTLDQYVQRLLQWERENPDVAFDDWDYVLSGSQKGKTI